MFFFKDVIIKGLRRKVSQGCHFRGASGICAVIEGLDREKGQSSGSRSIPNVVSIVHKYLFVKHLIGLLEVRWSVHRMRGVGAGVFLRCMGEVGEEHDFGASDRPQKPSLDGAALHWALRRFGQGRGPARSIHLANAQRRYTGAASVRLRIRSSRWGGRLWPRSGGRGGRRRRLLRSRDRPMIGSTVRRCGRRGRFRPGRCRDW